MPGGQYTTNAMEWSVIFPYGNISGISTCNTISGSWGQPYSGNSDNIVTETDGANCWCRMMYPVRSAWVFPGMSYSASNCAQYCADACGTYLQTDSYFRRAMYATAGN